MPTKSENIWVGTFINTGEIIVFDPALQLHGNLEVNFYSVDKNILLWGDPAVVRKKVVTVRGVQREDAISKYKEFIAWRQRGDAIKDSNTHRFTSKDETPYSYCNFDACQACGTSLAFCRCWR